MQVHIEILIYTYIYTGLFPEMMGRKYIDIDIDRDMNIDIDIDTHRYLYTYRYTQDSCLK